MRRALWRRTLLTVLAVLALSACGGGGDAETETGGGTATETTEAGGERTIAITASDDLRFDPDTVEVEAGETVVFEVTNVGEIDHELIIGDEAFHEEHEAEMQEMDDDHAMGEEMHTVTVEPGETGQVTYTFEEPGTLLYGCHVPGHWPGGMRGEITIG